jgi:hypothetical protein
VTDTHTFSNGPPVFDPEMTHAMGVAFDEVCRALVVPYNAKAAREAIAEKLSSMCDAASTTPTGYATRC